MSGFPEQGYAPVFDAMNRGADEVEVMASVIAPLVSGLMDLVEDEAYWELRLVDPALLGPEKVYDVACELIYARNDASLASREVACETTRSALGKALDLSLLLRRHGGFARGHLLTKYEGLRTALGAVLDIAQHYDVEETKALSPA